jgi:hypothetical protein
LLEEDEELSVVAATVVDSVWASLEAPAANAGSTRDSVTRSAQAQVAVSSTAWRCLRGILLLPLVCALLLNASQFIKRRTFLPVVKTLEHEFQTNLKRNLCISVTLCYLPSSGKSRALPFVGAEKPSHRDNVLATFLRLTSGFMPLGSFPL